jgi:hypothetical protein
MVFATVSLLLTLITPLAHAGGDVLTGWFGGEVFNYKDQGPAKKSFKNGASQIYLVGGNRVHQANVMATIPGEPGFNPNWNVNVVHTAPGIVVQDIIDAGLASPFFLDEGVVFDDADNIIEAVRRGLVSIQIPGIIVLCPVVSDNKTPVLEQFQLLTANSSF